MTEDSVPFWRWPEKTLFKLQGIVCQASDETRAVVLVTVILFGIAMIVLRCATEFGILVSPDSATYLSVAESLQEKQTFTTYENARLSHYPPGYPLTLAGFSAVTPFDVRFGGPRMVHSLAFAIFVSSTFVFLFYASRSMLFSVLSSLLVLNSIHLINVFSLALSEGPFICATAIGTFLLSAHIASGRMRELRLAAVFVGYACLVRFVGIVWIGCFAFLLLCSERQFRRAVWNVTEFVAISATPMLVWFGTSLFTSESATNRSFAWHPVGLADAKELLVSFLIFFTIQDGMLWLCVGALLSGACLVFTLKRIFCRAIARSELSSIFVCIVTVTVVGYFIFLVLSKSFIDRATPFDARLLSPVAWVMIPAGCMSLAPNLNLSRLQPATIRDCTLGCCFLLVVGGSIDTFLFRFESCRTGKLGLSGRLEEDRILHRWLSDMPKEVLVYSDLPFLPYLARKVRPSLSLPDKSNYTSGGRNEDYGQQVEVVRQMLQNGRAVLVYWEDAAYKEFHTPMTWEEILDVSRGLEVHRYSRYSTVGIPLLSADSIR